MRLKGAQRDHADRVRGDRHRRRRRSDHSAACSSSTRCSASTSGTSSSATQASFKLGIEFHELGHATATATSITSANSAPTSRASPSTSCGCGWRAHGHPHPLSDYSPAAVAAAQMPIPAADAQSAARHAAARLRISLRCGALCAFPAQLRGEARRRAHRRHASSDVERNGESGFIDSVRLRERRSASTATSSRLLGISRPAHRAGAARPATRTGPTGCPATAPSPCRAKTNRRDFCPTRARPRIRPAGSGAFRCSIASATATSIARNHISDDEAARDAARQPRRQDRSPSRDCCNSRPGGAGNSGTATAWRLGLAGGFMEPLESTSIHLVQAAVFRFLSLMPTVRHIDPSAESEFNRLSIAEYEQMSRLHHPALRRERADRSRSGETVAHVRCRRASQHRIELFRARGKVARHDGQLFADQSWVAVMLGQGVSPALGSAGRYRCPSPNCRRKPLNCARACIAPSPACRATLSSSRTTARPRRMAAPGKRVALGPFPQLNGAAPSDADPFC